MAYPILNPRASAESLHSIHSIRSTTSTVTKESSQVNTPLQPCGASSSHFLLSQGSSILSLKNDTLELDRRFERHSHNVTLITVDNSSELGYGRIVSIDSSKEAIVWDYTDGEELHRFSPFEEIRVAAWMRNGSLSLGDCKGNVILFNPAQDDSILSHTISNPLCAIAPSADCTTFALGYNNGSILIATLTPFVIRYTLTTSSLSPSPITCLAWHLSSSKQKSDMLATQTRDGDLRVWSVAKSLESGEPPRVVRILSREGGNKRGNNWCAWSMKGRVVQHSGGETTIWDVRNKQVYSDPVNTPADLSGITVYGPSGNLFTVTIDYTVSQFGLYPPAVVVTVQHPLAVPPPSPPSSIEEKNEQGQGAIGHQLDRLNPSTDECNVAAMSSLGRIAHELELLEEMRAQDLGTGDTPLQRTESVSSTTTISTISRRPSIASTRSNLSINSGQRSTSDQKCTMGMNEYDMNTPIAKDHPNSWTGRGSLDHGSPGRKPHPLPHEITSKTTGNPQEDAPDLFGNIKARLPFVAHESPLAPNSGRKDEDELRREMLYTIFGWRGDVDGLIRDELELVDSRSLTAVMLRMWLGELDQNSISVLLGADFMVSADWLFLALSAMDGKKAWDTVARAMALRLVQKGEIHTAAVVLLALGNAKDAVDIYVTHKMHMEAVILAAYLWKRDWKRLSQMVKCWGEYASASHDNLLAERCFACCSMEAPEDLPSPITPASHKRQKSETESISSFIKNLPAAGSRASIRLVTSTSSLRHTTTSATPEKEKAEKPSIASRFFGWANDKHFTKSAIQTAIPVSAVSPTEQWKILPKSNTIPPPKLNTIPIPKSNTIALPKANTIAQRLPLVDETASKETLTQRQAPQAPPYETKLDIPKVESKLQSTSQEAALPPTQPPMSITSPVGNNNETGSNISRLADKFTRPGAPLTLGEQLTRVGTPSGTPQQKQGTFNESISRTGAPGRLPSGSPQPGAGGWDSTRIIPGRRPSGGLQIHYPTMDGVLHGDNELPPPVIKTARTPNRPASSRSSLRSIGHRGSGSYSDDSLPDIEEREEGRSRSRRRRVSPDRRGRSYSRRPGEGSHVRSPSSPLPYSAQAELYRDNEEDDEFDEDEEYYTRGRRRRPESPERGRSRSKQNGSILRSPSSPLPMSPEAHHYRDEEDDEFDERYYTRARSQVRARSHVRMDSRARADSRARGESRMRTGSRVRGGSRVRARDESPLRGESRVRGESRARAREESRVRGESRPRVREESRIRGESRPRVREESRIRGESRARGREEPQIRGESRARVREESRIRGESRARVREESRIRGESRARVREESRIRGESRARGRGREESQVRGESRARSRQPEERGRSMLRVPNMMRSPSSPLPMSPEAAFYRYDEDEDDDEPPTRARSRQREESRPRGRRREDSPEDDEFDLHLSDRTLTGWGRQFERSASVGRKPSVSELPARAMSVKGGIFGLPATPKAWKGPLSRAQSPSGTPSRGRSPAPGRSPLVGPPINASSLNEALSASSGGRAMSPSPRMGLSERGRSHSRGPSSLQNTLQVPYETPLPDTRGTASQAPPATSAQSHSRKLSTGKHVPTPLKNIAFYPTPKAQAPGSPPPLPIDMPVHPALQLNMPSVNGTTKVSAGPNSNFRLGGGASSLTHAKSSLDLGGHTIDSILAEPQGSTSGKGTMNHSGLVISIGMSKTCIEEEQKTGRMSPPMNPNPMSGDPRLGTPL